MFDDLFGDYAPDQIDCLLDVYLLKEEVKSISSSTLVDTIMHYLDTLEVSEGTNSAINRYLKSGTVNNEDRKVLENCYIILRNDFCINQDGEVCATKRG